MIGINQALPMIGEAFTLPYDYVRRVSHGELEMVNK